jgi:hypothetical protein
LFNRAFKHWTWQGLISIKRGGTRDESAKDEQAGLDRNSEPDPRLPVKFLHALKETIYCSCLAGEVGSTDLSGVQHRRDVNKASTPAEFSLRKGSTLKP